VNQRLAKQLQESLTTFSSSVLFVGIKLQSKENQTNRIDFETVNKSNEYRVWVEIGLDR